MLLTNFCYDWTMLSVTYKNQDYLEFLFSSYLFANDILHLANSYFVTSKLLCKTLTYKTCRIMW